MESATNQNFFGEIINDDHSIVLTAVDQRRGGTVRGGVDDIFMGDITASGLHDETARNLIDTVGGGAISPLGMHNKN